MMNIHIMIDDKFTDKFIEFINKYYVSNSNRIYVLGREGETEYSFVHNVTDLFEDVTIDGLGENGKVFIHSFYFTEVVRWANSLPKEFLRERMVLIIYGAELYNNRYLLAEEPLHPGVWLQEYNKRKLIRKVSLFMTFASSDYDVMCKWYGGSGKQFDCLYPSNANIEFLSSIRGTCDNGDKIVVLLGNSATKTNSHMEAFEFLANYREENIEIVCPLSYGDSKYGEEVAQRGKEIFGDKFVAVTEYMSIDDYSRMLNSVDIAVYNNTRQQATGNIEILGYLGKKIYVRSDTTTWQHYVNRDHCVFYDTKNILNMSFGEFCSRDAYMQEINYHYFTKVWDNEYIKSLWDKVSEFN